MLFQWVGLHPIAGIVTAYVSVACGYSANIVLSTMDPLLAHTTQEAALAQTGYQGNTEPLCNYFFMSASTVVITAIVYWAVSYTHLVQANKIASEYLQVYLSKAPYVIRLSYCRI